MHKLAETPITRECFLLDESPESTQLKTSFSCTIDGVKTQLLKYDTEVYDAIDSIINTCEVLRQKYLETKDIQYWRTLIQLLPDSWVQTRTVTMNYENLLAICSKSQRRNHKLKEWRENFIAWARELPYAQDFIFLDEISDDNTN